MVTPRPVVSTAYPYLRVRVEISGDLYEALALLDTGFEGDVVVPATALKRGAPPVARGHWELADGSIVDAPLFLGTLEVVGFPPVQSTVTALGEEYMLGRGIIDRFKLTFDHGRRIIVEF